MSLRIINKGFTLVVSGLDDSSYSQLCQSLTIPNPLWQVLKRMGKTRALYNVKKEFKYYKKLEDGSLQVGRGMETKILSEFVDKHYEYEDQTITHEPPKEITSVATPRSYQESAFQELDSLADCGVIRCDTGFGKTVLALEIIRRKNIKTLIVVPRVSLGFQFEETLREIFGCQPKDVGITITTFQSLHKITEDFEMVIVDEVHTAITSARLKLLGAFHPKYLYGLTATPDRSDGQGKAIHFFFGPIILDGRLPDNPPEVFQVESGSNIARDEYANMAEGLMLSDKRNGLIMKIAIKEHDEGRSVVILTKRVHHFENLARFFEAIRPDIDCGLFRSTDNKKDKEALLLRLQKNAMPFVVFGTYSMLSTGVDIPSLSSIIFAGDLKSSVLTAQSSGRIRRIFEGKKEPRIYDITDKSNNTFRRHAAERLKFYRKQGWKVQ